MNYERLWHTLKLILNILKRARITSVSPDSLIILMDQLEQGQNPIAPTGEQKEY